MWTASKSSCRHTHRRQQLCETPDVGQAVNFNVTYDAATNSVQIATNEPYSEDAPAPAVTAPAPSAPAQSSYTISTDHWSREDFSQQANPAVFTSVYDRELYNAIRQTLVDVGTENSAGDRCAYTMVSKDDYGEVKRMVGPHGRAFTV